MFLMRRQFIQKLLVSSRSIPELKFRDMSSCESDDPCKPKKKDKPKVCAERKPKACCPEPKEKDPCAPICMPPEREKRRPCPSPTPEQVDCGLREKTMCDILDTCCKPPKPCFIEPPCIDPVNLKRTCGPNDPVASLEKIRKKTPFYKTERTELPINSCDCDPTINKIDPRFRTLKMNQSRFQVEDGLPVFLKNGSFDYFLYNITLGGCVLGLLLYCKFIVTCVLYGSTGEPPDNK